MGVKKSVTMIGPGVTRSKIPFRHDILDVDETGADQEGGAGESRREPRFEAPEGGIERGESEPEIGHAHFKLERACRASRSRRRIAREKRRGRQNPTALGARGERGTDSAAAGR